jgi:hypothetical protein
MDKLTNYRQIVERVLRTYAAYPPSHGKIDTTLIVDREQDQYLLLDVGWDSGGRVHSFFGHVRLRNGKVWIEHDGTEKGFAVEFVEAGIPKDDIVLGFYRPEHRKLTEFAAA